MNKLFSLSILLVGIFCCVNKQKPGYIISKQQTKDTLINIMFQDYFENDTLGLKINDVPIVDKIVLNSSAAGFTNLEINVSQLNRDTFKLEFLKRFILCHSSQKLKLVLRLNGKISALTIDIHRGKYVGFSKNDNNTINLIQQDKPFAYE